MVLSCTIVMTFIRNEARKKGRIAMKQVFSENYNIAWFKLAECVARGEKERALNVYRLLSHSLDDVALACQLEGDILSSFNDVDAPEKYRQAAHLYQEAHRLLEAAAVYEKLLTLTPDNISYARCLVFIYKELGLKHKAAPWLYYLITKNLAEHALDKAVHNVKQLEVLKEQHCAAQGHERIVWELLNNDHVQIRKVMLHIKKTVDGFIDTHQNQALQKFLSRLKAIHDDCYKKACVYMEDDSKKG